MRHNKHKITVEKFGGNFVINGVWFYGLAGAGKTYASALLKDLKRDAFVIDGDVVRQFVSSDLGYTQIDRKVQIRRILGIMQIATTNKMFPIASSVSMNNWTLKEARDLGMLVIRVERQFDQILEVRDIYKQQDNVVGKDIQLENLDTDVILNTGDETFNKSIYDFLNTKIVLQYAN